MTYTCAAMRRCEETSLQETFSMGLDYFFMEIDQQYEKPEFPFHSQSSMWGEDFSVYSRIVLENCIFWYRIRILGAYSSAPNPKTTKALPPRLWDKQTQYKNYWCNLTTSLPHPRVVALKKNLKESG